jgi:hypothetical protein
MGTYRPAHTPGGSTPIQDPATPPPPAAHAGAAGLAGLGAGAGAALGAQNRAPAQASPFSAGGGDEGAPQPPVLRKLSSSNWRGRGPADGGKGGGVGEAPQALHLLQVRPCRGGFI